MGVVKVASDVSIPSKLWARCEDHGARVLPTVIARYESQGCYSEAKALRGIVQGKGAEVAAYMALRKTVLDLSRPDFEVYAERYKRYDPDMTGSCKYCQTKIELHIKCFDSTARDSLGNAYPESYVFNSSDPVCTTTNINKCKGTHSLCVFVARTGPMDYQIRWLVRSELLPQLLAEPNVYRHKADKLCVYGERLSAEQNSRRRYTLNQKCATI